MNSQLTFLEPVEVKKPEIRRITRKINPKNIGYSGHSLFQVYHGMMSRCNNPNQENYRFYGAVGIRVCKEWMEGIPAFLNDMEHDWPGKGFDIDRIDPSGDYCKENCRWIPHRQNISRANSTRVGARYKKKYGS